jgi:hypothetical protein
VKPITTKDTKVHEGKCPVLTAKVARNASTRCCRFLSFYPFDSRDSLG